MTRVAALVLAAALTAGSAIAFAPLRAQEVAGTTRLTGTVLDDGSAVSGATVCVGLLGWDHKFQDPVVAAETNDEGAFELSGVPRGPLDVWVRTGDDKWTHGMRVVVPGPEWIELDLAEKRDNFPPGFPGMERPGSGGGASGKVVGKGGAPLAGAAVGIYSGGNRWTRADDEGAFELANGSEGDDMIVRAAGYEDQLTKLEPGDRMTVKMKPVKPTVVKVKGPDGKPFPGAWVRFGDIERVMGTSGFTSLFPPIDMHVGAWTDEKGEASIPWGGTRSDEVIVTVFAEGCATATTTFKPGRRPKPVQLQPDRPVHVTATERGEGTPIAAALLAIPDPSMPPGTISAVPKSQQRGLIVVGRTDADGKCVVHGLPQDVKTLQVLGPYAQLADVKLERKDAE